MRPPRRERRGALALVAAAALAGCSAEAVRVADATLTDEATYLWLTSVRGEPREVFSTQDEKAVLAVRFAPNMVATYYLYHVRWIAPSGGVYLRGQVRTEWGSHREMLLELPIRGRTPSRMPGTWRVELWLEGRRLLERSFEIRAPPRVCPPLDRPPSPCVDRALEE